MTSAELVRKPFDVPAQLAQLLKAAEIEERAPEDVAGLLFGCLAHLFVGVSTQFPKHWPTFRTAFLEASDDLMDVLTSPNPAAMAAIMARQRRDRPPTVLAGERS